MIDKQQSERNSGRAGEEERKTERDSRERGCACVLMKFLAQEDDTQEMSRLSVEAVIEKATAGIVDDDLVCYHA